MNRVTIMPEQTSGQLIADPNDHIAIVVSRFNSLVTERLLEGAIDTLTRHGADESKISVYHAPGAFELPILAEKVAQTGKFQAVLTLGAVIQGETDHHDYINHAVAQGIMTVSRQTSIPILFGVLTCRTMEQALDRCGGKAGNKGSEAALAALETVSVLKQIS